MADGKPTFYDVFIFYGRVDSKAFAIALGQRLKAMGFGVWIDQDDIPLGVDFQRQIDEAIAQTHNFVFVISPHCALEIERALQLNKRIIPVMHRAAPEPAARAQLERPAGRFGHSQRLPNRHGQP